MNKKVLRSSVDFIYFVVGAGLYAAGVMIFITPSEISPGGVTGISAILSHFVGLSTGSWIIVLNIPLVIWGWRSLGAKFIVKTAAATFINAIVIDLFGVFLPQYTGDKLLAAIFGGLFSGAGLATVILRGATTGGIDIAAKVINRRYPHLSMGRLMLAIDAVIVGIAAIAYHNAETALYSVVAIFTSSYVMDSLLYGADKGKLVMIVSNKPEEIADGIFKHARRGVTMVRTTGGYTGDPKTMLMCAARRSDVAAVLNTVKSRDPKAFIVVAEAGEILGEGFHKRMKDD